VISSPTCYICYIYSYQYTYSILISGHMLRGLSTASFIPFRSPWGRSVVFISPQALLLLLLRCPFPLGVDSSAPPSILHFVTFPPLAAVCFLAAVPAAFLSPLAENIPQPQPDKTSICFVPPQLPNSIPTPRRLLFFPSLS